MAEAQITSLENRIRQLEDTIAVLQDAEQLAERLVEKVQSRLTQRLPVAMISEAVVPMAVAVPVAAPEPPSVDVQHLPQPVTPDLRPIRPPSGGRSWLVTEAWREVRAMWRMHVDPRYRLSWMGRLLPALLLAAILTSYVWLPGAVLLSTASGIAGALYVKCADVLLAYFLFKILIREARRYMEMFPDV
ncbi:MAG: hypothetical protein NZ700_02300 [Gemmataceae bacterium]|nr:hypothetical protein [Gemmataceae bacterium]MDW8265302.1 hypothetical protein [Gemmataceae bacterium]